MLKNKIEEKKGLIINDNPKSAFSESIKSIRTNLNFASIEKDIKVILVTSAEAGDGKSFISANLAGAYSQENKNVLIIDADLRRGRQHQIFNINNFTNMGYSNLILNYKENTRIGRYIINTENNNINLLPTGPTPPNPIELLASDKNKRLLNKLKERFDIIIIDCPPVIGLSDTLIMTQYSDANIVVVSNKKTKVELLNRVKKNFEQVNAKISGVVINKVPVKGNNYYSSYTSQYYSEE